jgi:hypothetical protein
MKIYFDKNDWKKKKASQMLHPIKIIKTFFQEEDRSLLDILMMSILAPIIYPIIIFFFPFYALTFIKIGIKNEM